MSLKDDLRSAFQERDAMWFESLLKKVPDTEPKFDATRVELPHKHLLFVATWTEWVQYRKKRRLTLTEATVRRQLAMLAGFTPEEACRIIDTSIANGWQGLFPDRIKGMIPRSKAETADAYLLEQLHGIAPKG